MLLGPPFLQGTKARALLNGDQIFQPMLAAIRGAQVSTTFETYIYWSGDIGREFADALAQRARQGVKVHVLLDWVGSAKMHDSLVAVMAQAGVQIRRFHAPHWSHLGRLNNRTHRKLLIIDGRTGFTGGVGVAPPWTGRAQDPMHWLDTHFRLTQQALVDALQRGVRLRIVVPGKHIDSAAVRGASRATWGPLLSAGATIAECGPTMYHCKILIVDGLLTSVGSTNFDNRSFRLNDEATLNIVDRAFASAQTANFETDLALAHSVRYAAWQARPARERFGEWVASVIGTQL